MKCHEQFVSNGAREVHGSNARMSATRRRESSKVAAGPTIGASLHRWIPTGSKQLRATTEMTSSHLVVITPPIREARNPFTVKSPRSDRRGGVRSVVLSPRDRQQGCNASR